jgi:hypothetical protein
MSGFIPSHFLTFLWEWNVTPELHFWPTPLQAHVLVLNPKLRLQHHWFKALVHIFLQNKSFIIVKLGLRPLRKFWIQCCEVEWVASCVWWKNPHTSMFSKYLIKMCNLIFLNIFNFNVYKPFCYVLGEKMHSTRLCYGKCGTNMWGIAFVYLCMFSSHPFVRPKKWHGT